MAAADIEFGLVWDEKQHSFDVNLRFTGEGVDKPAHPRDALQVDLDHLDGLLTDEAAYGRALTGMVFGSDEVRKFFQEAVQHAAQQPLHFRIHLDAPPRFHAVRWELLQDPRQPDSPQPIVKSQNILFSRYLSGRDWRPVPLLPVFQPRALIVVAAPDNLDEYRPGRVLAPIDRDAELHRASEALAGYQCRRLPAGQATLAAIVAELNQGIHVLYLVAHGAMSGDVPVLYLEGADGSADAVDARELAERIANLEHRPSLVVLSSCQSAGGGGEACSQDEGALAPLGPRLARVGVAAVVAMQGNVTKLTAERFVPAFFKAFRQDGVVDRAMAVARGAIEDRPDWWVPVLYSRLRQGCVFQQPQSTAISDEIWEDVIMNLKNESTTAVLGPGLAEGILGSRQEIAQRWVRRWQMPIAPHGKNNLAQVAQYLSLGRQTARVSQYLQEYLRTELRERRENATGADDPYTDLPPELIRANAPHGMIHEVGRRMRERDPEDPYRMASLLPVKVFVTTAWTDLLQQALIEQHREPVTACFPWTSRVDAWEFPSGVDAEPTVQHPLVYHMFGRLEDALSLVLTEDDYFEWLTAWIAKREEVPGVVRKALAFRSLLFLGYQLDDWDFRILFQSIKSFGASEKENSFNHVGVQLRPETQTIEPEAAQRYVESLFGADRVKIFWADTRSFLTELGPRLEMAP